MKEKPSKIDENTLIPISLLIIFLGGAFWISTLHWKVNASEKQLEEINSLQEGSIRSEMIKMGKSLARIEGKLKIEAPEGDQ
jgi:uncharacterized protein YneF (UPF0154 family)